jgi:hypothetical protein
MRCSDKLTLLLTDVNECFRMHGDICISDLTAWTVIQDVRFEVFTAVTMKNGVFWDVTPCGSCMNR